MKRNELIIKNRTKMHSIYIMYMYAYIILIECMYKSNSLVISIR